MKKVFLVLFVSLFFVGCATNPGQRLDEEVILERKEIEFQGKKVILAPLIEGINSKNEKNLVDNEILDFEPPVYRVGNYDALSVIVWDHPELSTPLGQFRSDIGTGLLVDDNGFLFYPYVGYQKVAGMTLRELRVSLTEQLARVIAEPQIDIKVLKYRSQKVEVIGAVNRSSTLYLEDIPLSVSEAINKAGGFAGIGDRTHIELKRDGKTHVLSMNEKYGDKHIGNIYLKDGDQLNVHSSLENKIYFAGALLNTGAIPLVNGQMSLTQGLSEMGGLDQKTSNAEALYVLRWEEDAIKVFNLDVQNPMALVIGDMFQLKPRDLVFVDTHGLVEWNRFLSLVLPTVNMIKSGVETTNSYMILKNRFK